MRMSTVTAALPLTARRPARRATVPAAVAGVGLALAVLVVAGVSLAVVVTTLLTLAAGTLVSEDLTCIAAGQFAARGVIHPLVAVGGCFAGIYLGDFGLWLIGRVLGRRVIEWRWLARRLPESKLDRLRDWFDHNAAGAIVAARFLPGTRLPLYVAAGTLGRRGLPFAAWTFVAALVWTPLLVGFTALFGDSFSAPFRRFFGGAGAVIAAIVFVFALTRLALRLTSRRSRQRLLANVSRVWRWEFWPAWLFYAPAIPWIVLLSLRRGGFRGFASITAANPGIPDGGFVGESKFQILSNLDPAHVAPTVLLEPSEIAQRLAKFDELTRRGAWSFPLILKPDVGQRGAGVVLARCRDDVAAYLESHRAPVLVQAYHAGPFEAGVFYCRLPDEPTGRIFSITDKQFPDVVGDGVRTLEQLVWDHPRFRMQAATFLARHVEHAGRVPPAGEPVRLAHAGNHCQGAMFRDGSHLITPGLERAIDAVARSLRGGFCFGRFDVRYSNADAFKRGDDLTVIELNGVTSESTNLYDPSRSLLWAYRTLLRQWSTLFRIADQNVRRGVRPTPPLELLKTTLAYYRTRETPTLSA
jgi:membrane protein DedA with SNARE-associated domain